MRIVSALVMLAATCPALLNCSGDGEPDDVTTLPTSSNLPASSELPMNLSPDGAGSQNTVDPLDGPSQLAPQPGTTGSSSLPPPTGSQPEPTVNPQASEVSPGVVPNTPPTDVPDISPAPSDATVAPESTGGTTTTDDTANTPVQPTGGGGENTGGEDTGGEGDPQPDVDENGKPNASPGQSTSNAQDYLRLGEIRILNNNWGSAELGCNAPMSVFVNQDSSFGWSFNRGDCDTQNSNQNPDFPQIEFGIHPFGIGNELVTSPEFSSTTLLPLQIHAIQSASVNVQNLTATLERAGSWNITFEFWLSEENPVTSANPKVYAELMTFWGWQDGRWPQPPGGMGPVGNGANDKVSSGNKNYTLWVQDDNWADGKWRYFQFRDDNGPQRSFNGTLDVKPFLDYLVSRGYSQDLWVTRLEVGSEIDDETQGSVQMGGITFEVNGESRSAIFGGN